MTKSDFVLALKNELLFTQKEAVVFTEDEVDAYFWQGVFGKFAPQLRLGFYKGYLPLDENKKAKGRNAVLAYKDFADRQLLLCVDSDYHYLLGDEEITSHFVFQTYTHSIENYQCFAQNINTVFEEIMVV